MPRRDGALTCSCTTRSPGAGGGGPAGGEPQTLRSPAACPPPTGRGTSGGPAPCGQETGRATAGGLLEPSSGGRHARRSGLLFAAPRAATDPVRDLQDHPQARRPAWTGGGTRRRVSPHLFRHTAAVHLLESGVEVNVIRGWLGHADLSTTNRYAEINTKSQGGSAPGLRATRYFGGIPRHANLEVRRDPPQLARLALIVMWPPVPIPASMPRSAPARGLPGT